LRKFVSSPGLHLESANLTSRTQRSSSKSLICLVVA
jgi:hypothetical protein